MLGEKEKSQQEEEEERRKNVPSTKNPIQMDWHWNLMREKKRRSRHLPSTVSPILSLFKQLFPSADKKGKLSRSIGFNLKKICSRCPPRRRRCCRCCRCCCRCLKLIKKKGFCQIYETNRRTWQGRNWPPTSYNCWNFKDAFINIDFISINYLSGNSNTMSQK